MVSLNLLQYREEVKRALLARKSELDQEWDPFVASWLAYAFLCEKGTASLLAQELFEHLKAWSQEESSWQFRRNIAPLLFLIWLGKQFNHTIDDTFVQKTVKALLDLNPDDKFSPLRYPEQVFLMTFGVSTLDDQGVGEKFVPAIVSQIKGSLARQALFTAALIELGEKRTLPLLEPKDVTDLLTMVWWAERYGVDSKKSDSWSKFESVADTVLLNKVEEFDTRRVLSEWELALLYEALLQETNQPDPVMLFDYYPLHPRIRQIAEEDFKRGNYFGAVFEACKVFYDFLRRYSDDTVSEVNAVKRVLGDPNAKDENLKPVIKLNPLEITSPDYRSQQNEQRGYGHLGIGIFMAFRHPKGHEPKDKEWVKIDPYEALDQLAAISLVMKRVQDATGITP